MMVSASIERALESDPFPIRSGVFVAVAGPSGAGKDTLLDHARREFRGAGDEIVFVRRAITRPADAGGEDFDALDEAAFAARQSAGAFALSWQANGLHYGLPASVDDVLRAGEVAVANVSRAVIPRLRERYRNVAVVIVTAPAGVLAERLAARGRETRDEVLARLERSAGLEDATEGAVVIENAGAPEEAGARLVAEIRRALAWSTVCDAVD